MTRSLHRYRHARHIRQSAALRFDVVLESFVCALDEQAGRRLVEQKATSPRAKPGARFRAMGLDFAGIGSMNGGVEVLVAPRRTLDAFRAGRRRSLSRRA